jgi:dihydrodipicolinate synthase/N-acetylneuraminate lyase
MDEATGNPTPSSAKADLRQNGAPEYGGVIAVVVTPCRGPGEIDPDAMRRLCSILGAKGCNGIFMLGSSGSWFLIDEDDRRALTVAAREGTPAGTRLYVGISGSGPKQSIRYASYAAQDGADAVVVTPPMMFKYGQDELVRHFTWIADESPLPVVLYHHPRVPSPLEIDTIATLSRHANIVGVKDTSMDIERFGALARATASSGLSVMQGSEKLIHEGLLAGGGGFMTALCAVAPEWHIALDQAYRRGDQLAAASCQKQIEALWRLFRRAPLDDSFSYFGYLIKRILQVRGWLERTDALMVGFEPQADFDQVILEHIREVGLTELIE